MAAPTGKRVEGLPASVALGIALRRRRRHLQLSQIELAAAAGYDRNYIGDIENARKSPSFRTLWDLCKVLKLRPSVLMAQVENATFEVWDNEA